MKLRFCSLDETSLKTCINSELWGRGRNSLKNWEKGDALVFMVNKEIAAVAIVEGVPFYDETMIWKNEVYPFRIPIRFMKIVSQKLRKQLSNDTKSILLNEWGKHYGLAIVTQHAMSAKASKLMYTEITEKY